MQARTSIEGGLSDTGNQVVLDENVLQVLPPNCQIVKFVTYKTAPWTQAARIIVTLEDGSESSYFMKESRRMIQGEYASMRELEKYCPAFVPKPYAQCELKHTSIPTYIFLMEYVDIKTEAPEPAVFCNQLFALHQNSVSPTGKFGFPIVTCHGPNWHDTTWEESWAKFFGRLLRQFFDREIETSGPDSDFQAQYDTLVTKVVPRLLGPLQAAGRKLKPCLVHGDLWEENTGTELHSGQPKMFDAAVFYAHNEYEFGTWRRELAGFGRTYLSQYLRLSPPSEPRDQWDDRNRLYSIKFELAHSIAIPTTSNHQRKTIGRDMQYLNAKYAAE